MPVAFGFSVGDFIAALELIGTVIDALRDTGNASKNFKILIEEIEELKCTLLKVQQIKLDPRLRNEELGIDAAATRGLLSIEEFWRKVGKFEHGLYTSGKRLNVKNIIARLKLTIWKKGDIEDFRARIQRSNTTFSSLLATVQIHIANLNAQDRSQDHASLVNVISSYASQIMTMLSFLAQGVSGGAQQIGLLLTASSQIVTTTTNIFTMVQLIHNTVQSISPEVMYYQRVDFIDCFGRPRPFFLETITCWEHLFAMLKIDLENAQCEESDQRMLERGYFVIEELNTRRVIDMSGSWDQCFAPGQNIAMSIVFCPKVWDNPEYLKCKEPQDATGDAIICPGCGVYLLRHSPQMQPRDHCYSTSHTESTANRSTEQHVELARALSIISRTKFQRLLLHTSENSMSCTMTVASQYRRAEAMLIRAADSEALLAVAGRDWIIEARLVIMKELHDVVRELYDKMQITMQNLL